ncbi:MAG: hypothetical protein ACU85V_00065 [Gammaproteobacteria bacterium]
MQVTTKGIAPFWVEIPEDPDGARFRIKPPSAATRIDIESALHAAQYKVTEVSGRLVLDVLRECVIDCDGVTVDGKPAEWRPVILDYLEHGWLLMLFGEVARAGRLHGGGEMPDEGDPENVSGN